MELWSLFGELMKFTYYIMNKKMPICNQPDRLHTLLLVAYEG